MSERPYRIIGGVSYPNLANAKQQTKFIGATINDETRDHYHDEAIRLNDEEVKHFIGKPICFEHDPSVEYGKVSSAWKGSKGEMRFQARIYTDTEEGRKFFEDIDRGENRGVSVGYSVALSDDNSYVVDKHIRELTICKEPFFTGAEVRVAASSNGKKYNNTESKFIRFNCSKMEPLTQTNQDASELAKVHDTLLKENEKMQSDLAQYKQMAEQLKMYQEAEKQARLKYSEDRKPVLEEVLKINEEQHKAQNGADAQLPESYVNTLKDTFLVPENEGNAQVILASARSWKAERDRATKERNEVLKMQEDLKKLKDDQQVAMAHVEASKRLHQTTEIAPATEVDVSASAGGKKLGMNNLFTPMGAGDRVLYEMATGRKVDINVMASAKASPSGTTLPILIPPVRNALRNAAAFNTQGGARMQEYMTINGSKYTREHMAKGAAFISTVETVDESKY